MKKVTVFCAVLGLLVMLVGPAVTGATTPVETTLNRVDGGGANPIIKVKWEMNGPVWDPAGAYITPSATTDDDPAPGAQFDPPGVWGAKKQMAFCTIATDPDGVADINGVYADWYYPKTIAIHADPAIVDQIKGGTTATPDYGKDGCGAFIHENQLKKLTKTDGYELFCNNIRTNNNDLPAFFPVPGTTTPYTYEEICGETGELMKETASVYCANKELIWEDPSGDYKVEIFAQDKAGKFSEPGVAVTMNYFKYLPLTSYEVDFTQVNYGDVKLNTHKKISGDKTWATADLPSVRNLGNTRLYMGISQDDMGLGKTDSTYNVKYDARVGNNEADYANYYPVTNVWLEDILDLSELEEMDFSILVSKFPNTNTKYTGTMTLSAKKANFRVCTQ